MGSTVGGIVSGLLRATLLMILFRGRCPGWWFDFALDRCRCPGTGTAGHRGVRTWVSLLLAHPHASDMGSGLGAPRGTPAS